MKDLLNKVKNNWYNITVGITIIYLINKTDEQAIIQFPVSVLTRQRWANKCLASSVNNKLHKHKSQLLSEIVEKNPIMTQN